ncbi:LacI family fructose operon transcriptional repressor [Pseudochelatococcus lubricantis]|uniref:LacI family fructose operon transcriptional repressor n=1 Tax=Pseudochelatococcus lubricantis TaxID=1538102 RepID=A0ABX0V1M1_9HYPH|nr:LacI family DNA-binding transcriptional regulator [Pseudochelatococcus lubricantis]NIJ58014.1 LacI family fructose operon transcriptional repressor [Pseudochelatococcus lubricantis]
MAKVGIKLVAAMAGVSPATVSRALSGKPVDAEMRARVEEAVRATGYRPNLAARRLRSRESGTIGLIVADIRNPFFTAVSRAVEDVAFAHGLRVILCNTDENPEKEAMYLRLMEEERVTGVIFAPTRHTAPKVAVSRHAFPVVLIDRSAPTVLHDAVVLDNARAAAALVEHLHGRGYRRIVGLFGAASTTGVERRGGYEAAMRRLGLVPAATFLDHGGTATEQCVADLLATPERPEAILASNGLMLLGVARALLRAGIHIPADIGLAGFDNEPWTELVGAGITVMEQPVEEIGRNAMAMLFDRGANPAAAARRIVLQATCIVRGSTPGPGSPQP